MEERVSRGLEVPLKPAEPDPRLLMLMRFHWYPGLAEACDPRDVVEKTRKGSAPFSLANHAYAYLLIHSVIIYQGT